MLILLTTYVPYNPSVWGGWWSAVMKTIGATVSVGFIVFGALFCIAIFKVVFRFFL